MVKRLFDIFSLSMLFSRFR